MTITPKPEIDGKSFNFTVSDWATGVTEDQKKAFLSGDYIKANATYDGSIVDVKFVVREELLQAIKEGGTISVNNSDSDVTYSIEADSLADPLYAKSTSDLYGTFKIDTNTVKADSTTNPATEAKAPVFKYTSAVTTADAFTVYNTNSHSITHTAHVGGESFTITGLADAYGVQTTANTNDYTFTVEAGGKVYASKDGTKTFIAMVTQPTANSTSTAQERPVYLTAAAFGDDASSGTATLTDGMTSTTSGSTTTYPENGAIYKLAQYTDTAEADLLKANDGTSTIATGLAAKSDDTTNKEYTYNSGSSPTTATVTETAATTSTGTTTTLTYTKGVTGKTFDLTAESAGAFAEAVTNTNGKVLNYYEINSYEDLQKHLVAGSTLNGNSTKVLAAGYYHITGNVKLKQTLFVASNVVIDIDENVNITEDSNAIDNNGAFTGWGQNDYGFRTPDGLITVLRNGNLTLKGKGSVTTNKVMCGLKLTDAYEDAYDKTTKGVTAYGGSTGTTSSDTKGNLASLTVDGVTVKGKTYGISGNGLRHNTYVHVKSGSITGGETGIYNPQEGTLIIEDGTITGANTAVEIRAGELYVTGGTLTTSANANSLEIKHNGNGTATKGVALAIVQHTTGLSQCFVGRR